MYYNCVVEILGMVYYNCILVTYTSLSFALGFGFKSWYIRCCNQFAKKSYFQIYSMINERKTDIAFKFLIQALYGQNDYYKVKNSQTVAKTKRYYFKILETFSIAINETIIISDKTHMELLNSIILEGKERMKNLKTFDSLDNSFITTQTELILQLVGNNPTRNFEKNVPNRKDKWKLNRQRQIQYTQTNEQKLNQIYSLVQSKYRDRFPNFIDDFFHSIFMEECKSDFMNLMNWLKINHSDIYLEIV